jgi:ribosomal protein L11 methyltransferase
MVGAGSDPLNKGISGEMRASAEAAVYRWVAQSARKMTAAHLEKRLARRCHKSRAAARRMIRQMVSGGRLRYIYIYGQSYIDLSFQRPTPITRQILLVPPGCTPNPAPDQQAVILSPGAAFGDGHHPTTRLALKGLATLWSSTDGHPAPALQRGLDIGTGSGILAIAAARFGVQRIDALDLDPCALSEARLNVDHNRLGHRIRLSGQPLEKLSTTYDLILANLRLPTLCAIAPWIALHARPQGHLVVSGFRESESAALHRAYPDHAYTWRWREVQAGWCGAVGQKKPQ